MKKIRILLSVLTISLLLTACAPARQEEISKALGVDLGGAEIVSDHDDHGGFQGDGTTFTVLTLTEESAGEIEKSAAWSGLPLDETARALLKLTDKFDVPEIENGRYLLIDRQSAELRKEEPDILKRYSFNFTLALFDADARTLYYCTMDT